jgi:hypothetical protein
MPKLVETIKQHINSMRLAYDAYPYLTYDVLAFESLAV